MQEGPDADVRPLASGGRVTAPGTQASAPASTVVMAAMFTISGTVE